VSHRQREVMINAGLKHFQKFPLGSAGIFDGMRQKFSDITEITRSKIPGGGLGAPVAKTVMRPCRQSSNCHFVGVGMTRQFTQQPGFTVTIAAAVVGL